MSDKERLEQIKNRDIKYLLGGTQLSEDWEWLINRVEELEEENDELAERVHKLALDWSELVDERNRYKQALEFYADEETYETKFATDTDEIYDPFTLIELDEGKKARQALGWEEGK